MNNLADIHFELCEEIYDRIQHDMQPSGRALDQRLILAAEIVLGKNNETLKAYIDCARPSK